MNPTAPVPKRKSGLIPLSNVAALLVGTSLIGQLLGFLRTRLVNAHFSAFGPQSTDAYFAAFNIPDLFFFTLAAGALGVAVMPVLSDRFHLGDRKGMSQIVSSLLNMLAIVMTIVGVIIFVFAKPLIHHIVAPDLTAVQLNNAATIMRFLAFNPLFFTMSGILTSMQQTMGRFFYYAIAPLFYNASIIASIFIFRNSLGLVGLGVGACVGAILQLLVIMAGMGNTKFHWYPHINFHSAEFRLILKQLPPRSLDQGIDQVESIIETNFARRLGEGFISVYSNAYTLSTAPSLLIGTAISNAAFPRLNARLSQGRPDLFRRDFLRILRAMIWIMAPIIIICYFCRGYLAHLIFAKNSNEIAIVFGFLTVAIFFRTMYTLISRWFYARKDTKTPLIVSVFTISLNIALVSTLARADSYGVAGLAIAQSIVALVEVTILMTIMVIRDHKLLDPSFLGGCARIISVSGFSVVAGFIMITLYPLGALDVGFVTLGSKLFLISGVIILVHVGLSSLFGLDEVQPIIDRAKRIVSRPIKLDY
jgi:putative peptidoglycan lipid II flippase